MDFTLAQVAGIRAGRVRATLIRPGDPARVGSVRRLRQRYVRHDEDGAVAGIATEQLPFVLTILGTRISPVQLLDVNVARVCGYRTRDLLLSAWRERFPRMDVAQVVSFSLGDLRDRSRYLNWTGGAGGDYTYNPQRAMDELEVVDHSVTTQAFARDAGRRARLAGELAAEPLAVRVARIEEASRGCSRLLSRDLDSIRRDAADGVAYLSALPDE